MVIGRVARLVLAGALLSSPIVVPTIAGIMHFGSTSAAAAPTMARVAQVPTPKNDPLKALNLNASTDDLSAEEAKAKTTHSVEAMSLLLWGVSLVSLSLLLKWTVRNRQKQQVSASE